MKKFLLSLLGVGVIGGVGYLALFKHVKRFKDNLVVKTGGFDIDFRQILRNKIIINLLVVLDNNSEFEPTVSQILVKVSKESSPGNYSLVGSTPPMREPFSIKAGRNEYQTKIEVTSLGLISSIFGKTNNFKVDTTVVANDIQFTDTKIIPKSF